MSHASMIKCTCMAIGLFGAALSTEMAAVSAQTTTTIPIGERRTLSGVATGDKLTSTFFGRRSYCCSLLTIPSLSFPTFSSAENFQGLAATSLIARGFDGENLCLSDYEECNSRRQCWYEDPMVSAVSTRRFIVEQSHIVEEHFDVLCEETTLIGGFNTMVTDFNFLEISASGRFGDAEDSLSGFVILKRTITGQTVTFPFTLNFSGRTQVRQDFALHDLIGNADDFGQVVVIHNGAPGVVKARVTQYRITSREPLAFEPVLQEVLVPRVE